MEPFFYFFLGGLSKWKPQSREALSWACRVRDPGGLPKSEELSVAPGQLHGGFGASDAGGDAVRRPPPKKVMVGLLFGFPLKPQQRLPTKKERPVENLIMNMYI